MCVRRLSAWRSHQVRHSRLNLELESHAGPPTPRGSSSGESALARDVDRAPEQPASPSTGLVGGAPEQTWEALPASDRMGQRLFRQLAVDTSSEHHDRDETAEPPAAF